MMTALKECSRPRDISRGYLYTLMFFFGTLLGIGIISSAREYGFGTLSLPQWAQVSNAPQEIPTTRRVGGTQDAQEVLLESLNLLRDVMNNIAGNNGHERISNRDLASAFTGIFGDLATDLTNGASGAALYLGAGIGNGTLSGLSVNPSMMKKNTAIAPATGINSVAQGLGQGLSASLLGSINVTSLLGGATSPDSLNVAALSLAQGLGSGAAAGLNLKTLSNSSITHTDGLNGIVGSLGQGLSNSFIGGVDIMKVLSMATGNTTLTGAQTNAAALSLAQGLGSGAASALKLTNKAADNTSFNTDGINGIAGNLGQGLSISALENINLTMMFSGVSGNISNSDILSAANGLGSGLAQGAAVGLGLQKDTPIATNDSGIGPIVQTFAKGLSQSFISNGTITNALKLVGGNSTSGSAASNLNVGKAAQGLAIGLVDGAQKSIENAGGVGALTNTPSNDIMGTTTAASTSTFDDGVGGAAVGFGNGLGSELSKVVLQALGKPDLTASKNTTTARKRSLDGGDSDENPTAVVAYKRATDPSTTSTTNSTLDLAMLNSTINPLLQGGLDTLGCQGTGGLISIALSILQKQNFNTTSIGNLTSSLGSFTNQTYTIKQGGNTYTVNIAQLDLTLNGNGLVKAIVLIVLHVFFGIITYVVAVPLVMLLGSARTFAIMSGRLRTSPVAKPRNLIVKFLTKIPRWQVLIGAIIVVPGGLITFIFGVLGDGKRSHFVSVHGILGLVLTVLTLAAAPLALVRRRAPGLSLIHGINLIFLLAVSVFVIFTAFLDISSISLCATQFLPQVIFIIIGFLLSIPFLAVLGCVLVETALRKWFVGGQVVDVSPDVGKEKGGEIETNGNPGISRPIVIERL